MSSPGGGTRFALVAGTTETAGRAAIAPPEPSPDELERPHADANQ